MLKRRKENPDEGRALLPSMSLSLIYPSWKNRDQLVRATSRATGSFSSGTSFLLPVQSQATQSFEPRLSPCPLPWGHHWCSIHTVTRRLSPPPAAVVSAVTLGG